MLLLQPGGEDPDSPDAPEKSLEEFFQACGGRHPLRLTVYNPDGRDVDCHHFERPFVLIGRSDECDLRLVHPEIEERHAYLQLVDGRVTCFRFPRTSAEMGRAEPELLSSGDDIEIGPYRIELSGDEFSDAEPGGDAQPTESDARSASLRFVNSRNRRTKGKALPLTEPVTLLGRSKHCHVRLADNTVSRVHCGLIVARDGVWVVDLLSSAGVQVDERYVAFRRLEHGDELQVGKFRICVDVDVSDVLPLPSDETAPTASDQAKTKPARKPKSRPDKAPAREKKAPSPASSQESGLQSVPPRAEPAGSLSRPTPAQGFSEGFVMSLVNQFAMMQQQSFIQMQQMVGAMLEAMSDSHREHVTLIRDELRKIDEISHELLEIRQQMSAADATALPSPAQPEATEDAAAASPEAETTSVSEELPDDGESVEANEAEFDEEAALPPEQSEEILEDFAAATKGRTRSKRQEKSVPLSNLDQDGTQIHANLVERMAALDRERNSRWQKILGMLTGAESGR